MAGQREADRAAATGVAEHTDGRHGPGHWRTGEVLRRLVAEGVQVCAAHTPAKAAHLERAGIATVALDLDRPDTWPPALDGIEQVFFVGYVGPRFAETSGALAAARRAGARRLVKLSASFCWWWFGGARRSNAPVGLATPGRVVLGGVGF